MKVKDYILETEIKSLGKRLETLKEMRAPEIIIKNLGTELKLMKEGVIKIGGKDNLELLEQEFEKKEVIVKGKFFHVLFNDTIEYYPNGRYGRYITKKK